MATAVTSKQMHVNLPSIPVEHSAKLRTQNVTPLSIKAQAVEPTKPTGLPAVRSAATPRPQPSPSAVNRPITSASLMSEGELNKRSELQVSWLKANNVANPFKYTVEELHEIVQEKLNTGFHGLKHLFKSQTAHGNGVVSREALHKILVSVCGYISKDLFDRYMKKLGLQHAQYTSFQMFISKFPDNEAIKREWVAPIQQAKILKDQSRYKEFHLRDPSKAIVQGALSPASYFMLFLRDLVRNKKFKPELHLPDAVRNGDEELLKPHLRRIVTMLSRSDITDKELDKLWLRFDSRGVGSVSRDEFYKVMGYNEHAQREDPVAQESRLQMEQPKKTLSLAGGYFLDSEEPSRPLLKSRAQVPKGLKNLNSVIEELLYNLELPAENMKAAFQQFDELGDNFVAKVIFRKVLAEFGFPIGALSLDDFISRNSLRVLNGLLEYKDFIQRFTNKKYYGLVNRIVNDKDHIFNKEPIKKFKKESASDWTAEEVEAGLVEYFVGSYLRLITTLRNSDTEKTRLLPVEKVKPVLEKLLGREFKSEEWKYLLSVVGVTEDGLIPYENIIAVINKRQPYWNQKSKLGHQITVIPRPATTLELERLREGARKEKTMHTHFAPTDHLRSLDEISTAIRELMKTRFRSLDYAYRYQDRRMTGRLDKAMLIKILKQCGLDFKEKEMDKLWSTFALAPDGLYTWSKFCQRYCNDTAKLKQAGESEYRNEDSSITSAEDLQATNGAAAASAPQVVSRTATARSKVSDPVLTRLQSQIRTQYNALESAFKRLDVEGRGQVTLTEAERVFGLLKVNVKPEELEHIIKLFDLERSFRFHYKSFLSFYKDRPLPSRQAPPPSPIRPSSKLLKNRLVLQLKGRVPEMRRQFKKSDPLGQGFLSFRDFRQCLNLLGVNYSVDESFSEVASSLDHNLKGQINYEEFTSLCI